MPKEKYIGTVQKVFTRGRHGPYAKARTKELGTVTFSLDPPTWIEAKLPDEGMFVVMTDVLKKTAGWRAEKSRFMRPEDEEATETTASTATPDERKGANHG